ncbi:MAG: hypothetical protein COX96_06780 [Candidatus Omnitrophica bacterium CG_4_10_14_0_2_um_filter_44_9]|nr:MAG: hypothetical protein AUJ70_04025 [Candidatus Omnitrophica bacterium CG1_02_40_15]PIY83897.1 MAG: hypothetical protein COY78_00640 [Candidatus Omnitrophica bacterium CG_4_10_14_0_8_um_filter_44_12]PIZ83807.1 MAG: hypothetical protein COX96_06780 [Candidatus Omnitrophica bacterium CG_4_10_14_0_2_um_filter_44_9]
MLLKIIIRSAIILIIIVILIGAMGSAYLALNGRKLLLSEIEKNLGVKAQISSLRVSFPPALIVDGFAIQDSIKIDRIIIYPSLFAMLRGDIILNTLIFEKPALQVIRNSDDSFDLCKGVFKNGAIAPEPKKILSETTSTDGRKKTKKPGKFYLNHLKIKNANIEFVDNGIAGAEPFKIRLANVDLDVFHPILFNFFRMQFKGQGDMLSTADDKIGKLSISGWVDILAKDMDANITLSGARLTYLKPYYKKFLKRDLSSGDMDVTALLISKNNNMTADCHLELNNIAFKEPQAGAPEQGTAEPVDFTLLAVNSLLSSKGKVIFDFSIRTKMDKPRFEKIKIKGSFLQSAIQGAISKPPKETIEDFNRIGKQFESIGKEFKKSFKNQ